MSDDQYSDLEKEDCTKAVLDNADVSLLHSLIVAYSSIHHWHYMYMYLFTKKIKLVSLKSIIICYYNYHDTWYMY